jgi:hypothetical protein
MFRDSKFIFLLPAFLKRMKKAIKKGPSASIDLGWMFQSSLRAPQSPTLRGDLMLVRFLARFSPGKEHKQQIEWVIAALRLYQHTYANLPDSLNVSHHESLVTEFLKFMKTLRKVSEPKFDQQLIQMMVEMLKSLFGHQFPLMGRYYLLPVSYPEACFLNALHIFQREFSLETFTMLLSWTVHPKCQDFRRLILERFILNSTQVFNYVNAQIALKDLPVVLTLATRG